MSRVHVVLDVNWCRVLRDKGFDKREKPWALFYWRKVFCTFVTYQCVLSGAGLVRYREDMWINDIFINKTLNLNIWLTFTKQISHTVIFFRSKTEEHIRKYACLSRTVYKINTKSQLLVRSYKHRYRNIPTCMSWLWKWYDCTRVFTKLRACINKVVSLHF